MVSVMVDHARSLGLEKMEAKYLPTERNKPCLEFWRESEFDPCEQDMTFTWSLDRAYAAPESIEIVVK